MTKKQVYLKVKDHSVSGETFQLLYNENLDMLETSPQPEADKLPGYYKSEDYISHTDAKRNLFEKAYHFVKGVSLKRKLKLINGFSTRDKYLLDIGCGTGDFLQVAQSDGWRVCGVEPNEKARTLANEKTGDHVFDIDKLSQFEKHSFDVITLWHVLEHLPNLQEHILILKQLLKPEGRLVIAVPNYKSYDAWFYKSHWAAYDVPRHLWHFSQQSISRLFDAVNMQVEKTSPMKFDAYYVSLLSEKYRSGWMNIFRAGFIAQRSNWKAYHSGEYSSLIYTLKNS